MYVDLHKQIQRERKGGATPVPNRLLKRQQKHTKEHF